MSAFGLVTGEVLYGFKRVVRGLIHIYGQARSHSIGTDAPRVHGSDKDQSAAVCRRGTRFGNEGEENGRGGKGRGRAKVVGFLHPRAMPHPRSTYGLSGGSKMRNTPSHPHSSILSICDVRVLIDR